MKTAIIVPARLQSERFPRKLLHPVKGKPIIVWTAERIRAEAPDYDLYFAVGEPELVDVLEKRGYQAVLTDPALASGTDRIAAANEQIKADRVINVQADEPLVCSSHIRSLDEALRSGADLATLATPFASVADFNDPNKVKVVLNRRLEALYFSRSAIPYDRATGGGLPRVACFWHMGLYAYTAKFLVEFQQWEPSPLESLEKLEQLRALENRAVIGVSITNDRTVGIDTREDLEVFEQAVTLG